MSEKPTATRWPPTLQEDATQVTREQYLEMLIEASCWEASEMESGFMSWCERHVPTWRKLGYDETWTRQRIEMAQITRGLHRKLKEQGLTMLEIRDELRKAYADHPELYDLAVERERLHPGPLRYRGNTSDLRQRYTLRDLSTVEELELALAMSRYTLWLFEAPEKLTQDQISLLMETYGKQLRATFIAKHKYQPEDSITPYVPVTIDGPQDHDAYYAKEYP
jgi:hypothetical protein